MKLNDACANDPFPTPFIDEVLENVGRQEAYSFTDGFSGTTRSRSRWRSGEKQHSRLNGVVFST